MRLSHRFHRAFAAALVSTAWWTCAALAQVPLLVDGRDVGGARTDLVAGTAYAPIDRLAPALGTRWLAGSEGETIVATLGGHVVVVTVVDDPATTVVPGAIRLNGSTTSDRAAIRVDGDVWMPVAAFARAFGASTSFVGDPPAVTVVSARGTVLEARASTSTPTLDLASVAFDAPVRLERRPSATPGRFEWLVPRAVATMASTTSAGRISRFDLVPTSDGVLLRLDVVAAVVEVIETAAAAGTTVRFRVTPDPAASAGGSSPVGREDASTVDRTASPAASIVLEVGATTGSRDGDGAPAASRAFVDDVSRRLDAAGNATRIVDTVAGSRGDPVRLEAASTAAVYLAVHVADIPVGEVRLWVLGEWDEALDADPILRRRAEAFDASDVTDEIRREILLGLVPRPSAGLDAARRLSTALFDVGGFRSGSPVAAPIADLRAAGGRGVLLEASAQTLSDPSFAQAMALALRDVAGVARR